VPQDIAVLALRHEYPRWGKNKLVVLVRRRTLQLSTFMVGRILSALRKRDVLIEPPRQTVLARRWKLRHHPWATRKPRFWPVCKSGDSVALHTQQLRPARGILRNHFSARDIVSRGDVVEVQERATSLAAAHFLDSLIDRMPFPIAALQVDGGSEFAAEFEQACQQRGLPPFVLPSRSPKLNGQVEPSDRPHHEEFYQVVPETWEVSHLNPQLPRWELIYNTVRPPQALGDLTPLEFLKR
jgi:transposase InsO family protein